MFIIMSFPEIYENISYKIINSFPEYSVCIYIDTLLQESKSPFINKYFELHCFQTAYCPGTHVKYNGLLKYSYHIKIQLQCNLLNVIFGTTKCRKFTCLRT